MVQLGYHIKCQTAKTLTTAFFLKRLANSNILSSLLLIAHFLSSEEGLFISFYMCKERFVCMWPCVTTWLSGVPRSQKPGTGLMVGCKPPCGFGEPDPGPLQEHQALDHRARSLAHHLYFYHSLLLSSLARHPVSSHTTLSLCLFHYLCAFAFGRPLNSGRAGMECLPVECQHLMLTGM